MKSIVWMKEARGMGGERAAAGYKTNIVYEYRWKWKNRVKL